MRPNAIPAEAGSSSAKSRGAFYTPPTLTRFLVNWAIRGPEDRVLEPSAGDGAFLRTIVDRFEQLGRREIADSLVGIEPDHVEALKCRSAAPGARILERDFFEVLPADLPTMSAVVGNPPYIRYHHWTGDQRRRSLERAQEQDVTLSSLASSWAAFVIHSAQFLGPEGRLGLVLPIELLTADYASAVRRYLPRRFASVLLLAIDQAVFPDARVSTVLMLASNDGPPGVRVQRVGRVDELDAAAVPSPGSTEAAEPLTVAPGGNGRWNAALDPRASTVYQHLVSSRRFARLGSFADVDIGVVTGADQFFVLDRGRAAELELADEHLIEIVRRPAALAGLQADTVETSVLLSIGREPTSDLAAPVSAYLRYGESIELDRRYKCSHRRPWYAVPIPKARPQAFFRYMNHDAARLVTNEIGSLSTNLLHGVFLKPGTADVHAVSAAMLSSPTRLSAEIEGRTYGGGVLKLETKEAERVLVPTLTRRQEALLIDLFPRLDALVRGDGVAAASRLVDEALSFDHDEVIAAAGAYRQRRLRNRRSSQPTPGGLRRE